MIALRILATVALALASSLAAPVSAQGGGAVVAAQAAGSVGERYDGYLGMASGAPDALRRQVATVNIKRRALYASLASRRGVSPEEVGVTAACQLLARVGVGQSYMMSDNVWRRRLSGQRAPRPDYCG